MIISAIVIKKPRHVKKCAYCGEFMWHNKPRLKLVGARDKRDPISTIYTHLECSINGSELEPGFIKIREAIKKYNQSLNLTSRLKDGLSSS